MEVDGGRRAGEAGVERGDARRLPEERRGVDEVGARVRAGRQRTRRLFSAHARGDGGDADQPGDAQLGGPIHVLAEEDALGATIREIAERRVRIAFVFDIKKRVELTTALVPQHTWLLFDTPLFQNTNVWGGRVELGFQLPVGPRLLLGGAPLAVGVLSGQSIGVITTWEPRFWTAVVL